MKRLTFITQFKIELLLPFTGYRKVFRKMPAEVIFLNYLFSTMFAGIKGDLEITS